MAQAVVDGAAPAVLKLLVPRDGDVASHEITVLRQSDGVGCVRLLRHDEARDALLLERLADPCTSSRSRSGRRHVHNPQRPTKPAPHLLKMAHIATDRAVRPPCGRAGKHEPPRPRQSRTARSPPHRQGHAACADPRTTANPHDIPTSARSPK